MSVGHNKVNFVEMYSKGGVTSPGLNFEHFMTSGIKDLLNGSIYKPLKYSESTKLIAQFRKLNQCHGFDLNKMCIPKGTSAFIEQIKILILKMKIFSEIKKDFKLQSREDLSETFFNTLTGGFEFNSLYKKRLEGYTREYLRGETDFVYQDFPASHLLPWLDEEPIGNIYVFHEPLPQNERLHNQVVSVMHRNIQDGGLIRDIDLIDALYLINEKKTNHLDKKGRTLTSHVAREGKLDISFPEYQLDYLFKKVTTDPCTSRCAGLSTVQGRNLIYTAHSNLDLVTRHPNDMYRDGVDPKLWSNWLSPQDDFHYIMIDFKKSGLTTNRNVIKSVYKAALEHYPDYRPWSIYLDCLENVMVNGMWSKRGTSLGMDDNAISFYLASAFDAWLEHHEKYRQYISFSKFKGDDQIIGVKGKRDVVQKIFRSWVKRLTRLGFLINATKSMIGKRGQFCEVVGKGEKLDTKEIEFGLNVFDCLGAYNIVDFKIRMNSLYRSFLNFNRYSKIFDYCFATGVRAVPAEFIPEEIYAPFEMGGYVSCIYESLNVFVVEALEDKFKMFDRRLFNVIGADLPEPSFGYKRTKLIINNEFKDLTNLIKKLERISHPPLSKGWKESYDFTLNQRREMFNGKVQLKGSRYFSLLDKRENYVPPIELCNIDNRRNMQIYKSRYPRKMKKNEMEFAMRRPMSMLKNKASKRFFYIDEIRARLLLRSADVGNTYKINFYHKVPISTLIWSVCKPISKSDYSTPIAWSEFVLKNGTKLDHLWTYYRDRGVNLYHIKAPYDDEKGDRIADMFEGPDDSDSLIICPYSGFPRKFNSARLEIHVFDEKKSIEQYFKYTLWDYFPNWMDDKKLLAWYGPTWRNASDEIRLLYDPPQYDSTVIERMEHYPGSEYCPEGVDPELFFWYHEHYIGEILENVPRMAVDDPLTFEIVTGPTEVESTDESYELEHNSDSDELENYLRDNFLDDELDEENPVNISSSESEED